jgi:hypothetical protein
METTWSDDIEQLLDNIRMNSVIMNEKHQQRYFYLKGQLRYFRVPVIVLSGFNSVISVGLQPFTNQQSISLITCLISLFCGIIGSIELYLAIQSQMENELITSKEYYYLSTHIFKILTLRRENRNIQGLHFLDESYKSYIELIEKSNIIYNKIQDKLTPLDGVLLLKNTEKSNTPPRTPLNIKIPLLNLLKPSEKEYEIAPAKEDV